VLLALCEREHPPVHELFSGVLANFRKAEDDAKEWRAGKKIKPKVLSAFEVEESEDMETVLADLSKVSLPWEDKDTNQATSSSRLSKFVLTLLNFVSLPDGALAIQAVQLLARLCRRRKDFLEALDSLQLLDVGDHETFNSLEPWVKETDRVIDKINQIEDDVATDQGFLVKEGLEHYAHQFEHGVEWHDEDLGRYIDNVDPAERVVEYFDQQQNHQVVLRVNQSLVNPDLKVQNFDFDIKSVQKRETTEDDPTVKKIGAGDDGEEFAPMFVGVISPRWNQPKDTDDFRRMRAKAPNDFFGCDELGHLYIRGHPIAETFGGFQQGNCVGVELDYTEQANPKLFLYIDGYRVAALDREMEDGLIPCVILTALQQRVKLQQGRPRRGKGIVFVERDTKIEDNTSAIDLMYDVMRDSFYVKNPSCEEENKLVYQGWNASFSTSASDRRTEFIIKIKAFNKAVEPKKTQSWCLNLSLTHSFIERATFTRGARVAQQKAFNSFYTNTTTHLHRTVAKEWYPVKRVDGDKNVETGLVSCDISADFVYGSTSLFICFNEEDPAQLSPEQDPEITVRLLLTHLLPVKSEKAELIKLFNHFIAVCKQGDGHLLHYHKVELLALRVLKLLRCT